MTFTDAAVEVLRLIGRPLHYKEITDFAIDKNLLSHVGKSPEVTMGARLAALMKKDAPDCPLVRVKPGVFALREWDDKTIKAGMEGKRGKRGRNAGNEASSPASPVAAPGDDEELDAVEAEPSDGDDELVVDADAEVEATDGTPIEAEDEEGQDEPAVAAVAQALGAASTEEDDDDEILVLGDAAPPSPPATPRGRPSPILEDEEEPPAPEERMRAELLAGAAEIFDEEDDDDQPLLGGGDDARAGESQDSRRRRRRRRGRGTAADGALPSYTATPVEGAAPAPRPQEGGRERERSDRDRGDRDRSDRSDRDRDRDRGDRDRDRDRERPEPRAQVLDLHGEGGPNVDDLAGRDLGDAVAQLLATFDRNLGPVSLRQVAETAQRRGKVGGDQQLVQSLVAAAVRADNHRRVANGLRPRFRFAGGRVGLTDWSLSNELVQAEADAIAAVERYREASRRAFAKKIAELPGHAFVELASLALERVGVSQLRAIRRAGVPGYEAHFAGVLKSVGEDLRIAVVIRRDGREIGRERVTELRGALHHYGPATVGWILTSGQVLSGAKEEAASPGAAPISLTDGHGLARLCEEHDVAVIRARLPIAIPDIDLLEALRAS